MGCRRGCGSRRRALAAGGQILLQIAPARASHPRGCSHARRHTRSRRHRCQGPHGRRRPDLPGAGVPAYAAWLPHARLDQSSGDLRHQLPGTAGLRRRQRRAPRACRVSARAERAGIQDRRCGGDVPAGPGGRRAGIAGQRLLPPGGAGRAGTGRAVPHNARAAGGIRDRPRLFLRAPDAGAGVASRMAGAPERGAGNGPRGGRDARQVAPGHAVRPAVRAGRGDRAGGRHHGAAHGRRRRSGAGRGRRDDREAGRGGSRSGRAGGFHGGAGDPGCLGTGGGAVAERGAGTCGRTAPRRGAGRGGDEHDAAVRGTRMPPDLRPAQMACLRTPKRRWKRPPSPISAMRSNAVAIRRPRR